nr:transposase, Ptta/En/Spm [Tanacetum cinerariifolium]
MKKGAFIALKSERVAAAYNGALVDKYGSEPANHPIYDDGLWKQCARDDMKGGLFGWGSMSDSQYTMTSTPSTTRCTGAPTSGSKDVQVCFFLLYTNNFKFLNPYFVIARINKHPPTAAELLELTHMKKGAFIALKSERVAWINMDQILLTIPYMMMAYGNNVPERI